MNLSGEAMGGLALTPLARSRIPPATQANCYQYTFSNIFMHKTVSNSMYSWPYAEAVDEKLMEE